MMDNNTKEEFLEKIHNGNYAAARTLILNSSKTCPWLEHGAEMLAVCEILCSSEIKNVKYGIDWYLIFQLFPSAEQVQIEAQYCKLLSLLKTVKNCLPVCKKAMQYLHDAFAVLSHPIKRAAFDAERSHSYVSSFILKPPNEVNCRMNIGYSGTSSCMNISSAIVSPKRTIDASCSRTGDQDAQLYYNASLENYMRTEVGSSFSGESVMLKSEPFAGPHNLCKDFSAPSYDAASLFANLEPSVVAGLDNLAGDSNFDTTIGTAEHFAECTDTGKNKHKWTSTDFMAEQVWAVYDGHDAMPRSYVKVSHVITPNIVLVKILEPYPVLIEEISWMKDNMPLVCGMFRVGTTEVCLETSRFCYVVDYEKCSDSLLYKIFPRQGEIWATYKNSNRNCKSFDASGYQYQVVEILSNFSEQEGIRLCSLVEMEGCLSIFRRVLHDGYMLTKQLHRQEMVSFSHRIPAFTVFDLGTHEELWQIELDARPPRLAN